MEKLKIELNEYNSTCGDGCCVNYGLEVKVNNVPLFCENTDLPTQIHQILTHLGYEVEIIESYNGEIS